jgi:endonuclease/exonuclease/phosphatase family metal-dependent hydrolase
MNYKHLPVKAKLSFFTAIATAILIFSPSAVRARKIATAPSTYLSVVSLNLAKQTDPDVILGEFRKSSVLSSADVLLFQEVVSPDGRLPGVADALAAKLGFHVAFAPSAPRVKDLGLAILSRYPIRDPQVQALKAYDLLFRSRSRISLAATIEAPREPVRVVNLHLDTRLNAEERAAQLAPVLDDLSDFDGPRIIGGDFNTNHMHWIARVLPLPWVADQAGPLHRLMAGRGLYTPFRGFEPTFDYLGMQLDWIYLKHLTARSAVVQPLRFSDHHALAVQLD